MRNESPKYVQARQNLINYLSVEGLEAGDKLPTERELPKLLNVSLITIRRALDDLYREGVIDRLQGRGTFLKKKICRKSHMGQVVYLGINMKNPHLSGTFYFVLRHALNKRGHDFRLIETEELPDDAIIKGLSEVNGIFISGNVTEEWTTMLKTLGIPFVIIGPNPLGMEAFWSVSLNWRKATRSLVRFFHDQGCKRIGLLNGGRGYMIAHEIYKGYCSEIKQLGLTINDELIIWTTRGEYEQLKTLGKSSDKMDALIVEQGCLLPFLSFHYSGGLAGRKPLLGLLPNWPSLGKNYENLFEVVFESLFPEKAVDVLFQAMSTWGAKPESVIIEPKQITGEREC